jgi:hypothetical protein
MPPKGKGHSFADFVLRDDEEEEDPETLALAKELAELENARAERLGLKKDSAAAGYAAAADVPKASSSQRPPLLPAASNSSSSGSNAAPAGSNAAPAGAESATEDKVEPTTKSKSVADRILGLDSAADEADAEFAKMEEDFQKQLQEFQAQKAASPSNKAEGSGEGMLDSDPSTGTSTTKVQASSDMDAKMSRTSSDMDAKMSSTGMSSAAPPPTADGRKASHEASAAMSSTGMSGTATLMTDPPEEFQSEAADELAKLRAQMEIIDTAFPDDAPDGANPAPDAEKQETTKTASNGNDFLGNSLEIADKLAKKKAQTLRDYREDAELQSMRQELDSLDNKLAAIKKQQELKIEQRKSQADAMNSNAAGGEDMVSKLQKQNAYLRQKFGHNAATGSYTNPRGLVNLDVSLLNSGTGSVT